MKIPGSPFIFKLDQVVFEGVGGEVGPLTLTVGRGEDCVVTLEKPRDGEVLVQIIKGITTPREGRVVKKSGEATGWIVPDGIIALVGEDFFSKTVEEELVFAARVGEARGAVIMVPFVSRILERSGFESRLKESIVNLSLFRRQLLILAAALCMLPECLIFLDPLRGLEDEEAIHYLDLLRYGKETVGFATVQIISDGGRPMSLGPSRVVSVEHEGGRF